MSSKRTDPPASARRLAVLAASAFVVLAAEPLFLLVDTAVVGHLGRDQLAALGAGGTIMTLLAIIGTSLEYGTTARAARYFGADRTDAAVNEGVQASWLALGAGLIAVVAGELALGPLVRVVVGDDQAVAAEAQDWLRIALLGLPGVLLVLAGNGWMRGVQDTRTPVRIVVLANVGSAIASPLLVYPLGLGLRGSAVANVGAQWIAAALCVRALHRRASGSSADGASGFSTGRASALAPHWPVMAQQLVVSRDLVLRSAAFQAAYLTAAGVAGRMGAAQLAAHQVGMQLWNLIALLLDSFAIAAQSLVGAALGSGDVDAARSTAWRVSRYGLIAGLGFAVVTAAGWSLIPAVFTSDAAVRHQMHLIWPLLILMMPAAGIVFALDGVLLGAGDNAFIRTVTILAALFGYVPLALAALHFGWGLAGVWAGLAAFIGLRLVGMALRARSGRWLIIGETR